MAAGLELRHARGCRTHKGGRCNCTPTFRANVWDGRRRQLVKRTFTDRATAKAWRQDAQLAVRHGTLH